MEPYILLIEDDAILQRAFELKGEKYKIPLIILGDGSKAITFVNNDTQEPAQAVILDLMLPSASGFEVLSEIRKAKKWRSVPVVILTVLGQDEDVKKAQAMGIDDYLIKTDIKIDDVLRKCEDYLKK